MTSCLRADLLFYAVHWTIETAVLTASRRHPQIALIFDYSHGYYSSPIGFPALDKTNPNFMKERRILYTHARSLTPR